ncbi:MAG: hypothetical protein V1837_05120 [Candidatus Woesearchaeota archaeon]
MKNSNNPGKKTAVTHELLDWSAKREAHGIICHANTLARIAYLHYSHRTGSETPPTEECLDYLVNGIKPIPEGKAILSFVSLNLALISERTLAEHQRIKPDYAQPSVLQDLLENVNSALGRYNGR